MEKFVNVMKCESFLKVSQVYQTMQFSRLQALVPFATEFQLERAIVDVALENELQVEVINYSVITILIQVVASNLMLKRVMRQNCSFT